MKFSISATSLALLVTLLVLVLGSDRTANKGKFPSPIQQLSADITPDIVVVQHRGNPGYDIPQYGRLDFGATNTAFEQSKVTTECLEVTTSSSSRKDFVSLLPSFAVSLFYTSVPLSSAISATSSQPSRSASTAEGVEVIMITSTALSVSTVLSLSTLGLSVSTVKTLSTSRIESIVLSTSTFFFLTTPSLSLSTVVSPSTSAPGSPTSFSTPARVRSSRVTFPVATASNSVLSTLVTSIAHSSSSLSSIETLISSSSVASMTTFSSSTSSTPWRIFVSSVQSSSVSLWSSTSISFNFSPSSSFSSSTISSSTSVSSSTTSSLGASLAFSSASTIIMLLPSSTRLTSFLVVSSISSTSIMSFSTVPTTPSATPPSTSVSASSGLSASSVPTASSAMTSLTVIVSSMTASVSSIPTLSMKLYSTAYSSSLRSPPAASSSVVVSSSYLSVPDTSTEVSFIATSLSSSLVTKTSTLSYGTSTETSFTTIFPTTFTSTLTISTPINTSSSSIVEVVVTTPAATPVTLVPGVGAPFSNSNSLIVPTISQVEASVALLSLFSTWTTTALQRSSSIKFLTQSGGPLSPSSTHSSVMYSAQPGGFLSTSTTTLKVSLIGSNNGPAASPTIIAAKSHPGPPCACAGSVTATVTVTMVLLQQTENPSSLPPLTMGNFKTASDSATSNNLGAETTPDCGLLFDLSGFVGFECSSIASSQGPVVTASASTSCTTELITEVSTRVISSMYTQSMPLPTSLIAQGMTTNSISSKGASSQPIVSATPATNAMTASATLSYSKPIAPHSTTQVVAAGAGVCDHRFKVTFLVGLLALLVLA